MKVYRYMSMGEFKKMASGCPMVHVGNFRKSRTSSSGFCFLPEEIVAIDECGELRFSPEECLEFLSGIASEDILVEFEAPKSSLTESYGIYSNPATYGHMSIRELCADEYNRDVFIPLRYGIVDRWGGCDWYQFR